MSIKMLNMAWNAECKTNSSKLLLLALADAANDQGEGVEQCFLRIETLAKKTGMSKRAIQYATKELEEQGFLIVQKRYGRSNVFRLFENLNVQDLHGANSAQCANFALKSADFALESASVAPITITEPLPNQNKGTQRKKTGSYTFDTFLKNCETAGELPIPEDDKVFEYASKAGIPTDLLEAHWLRFRENYEGASKRYSDWRATFRNSVKGNWFKFWYVSADGTVQDTTHARQFMAASGVAA